jgi:hypothetical protein
MPRTASGIGLRAAGIPRGSSATIWHVVAFLIATVLIVQAEPIRAACHADAGWFERGCQTLEISGLYQQEVWDLNETRDSVAGIAVAFAHALFDGWVVAGEATGLRVAQPSPAGHVGGGTALLRRRFIEVGRVTMFGDIGLGFSYADAAVPLGGTQFNYLLQGGVGASRQVTARLGLIGHIRHLHVSNNSLAGRQRNPDFRGMGAQIGMLLKLKTAD